MLVFTFTMDTDVPSRFELRPLKAIFDISYVLTNLISFSLINVVKLRNFSERKRRRIGRCALF